MFSKGCKQQSQEPGAATIKVVLSSGRLVSHMRYGPSTVPGMRCDLLKYLLDERMCTERDVAHLWSTYRIFSAVLDISCHLLLMTMLAGGNATFRKENRLRNAI